MLHESEQDILVPSTRKRVSLVGRMSQRRKSSSSRRHASTTSADIVDAIDGPDSVFDDPAAPMPAGRLSAVKEASPGPHANPTINLMRASCDSVSSNMSDAGVPYRMSFSEPNKRMSVSFQKHATVIAEAPSTAPRRRSSVIQPVDQPAPASIMKSSTKSRSALAQSSDRPVSPNRAEEGSKPYQPSMLSKVNSKSERSATRLLKQVLRQNSANISSTDLAVPASMHGGDAAKSRQNRRSRLIEATSVPEEDVNVSAGDLHMTRNTQPLLSASSDTVDSNLSDQQDAVQDALEAAVEELQQEEAQDNVGSGGNARSRQRRRVRRSVAAQDARKRRKSVATKILDACGVSVGKGKRQSVFSSKPRRKSSGNFLSRVHSLAKKMSWDRQESKTDADNEEAVTMLADLPTTCKLKTVMTPKRTLTRRRSARFRPDLTEEEQVRHREFLLQSPYVASLAHSFENIINNDQVSCSTRECSGKVTDFETRMDEWEKDMAQYQEMVQEYEAEQQLKRQEMLIQRKRLMKQQAKRLRREAKKARKLEVKEERRQAKLARKQAARQAKECRRQAKPSRTA